MSARAVAAAAVAVAAATAPVAAHAGERDVPTVVVQPANPDRHGPDNGVWFVYQVAAGRTTDAAVRLVNPARVPQTLRLYARDLEVGANGTADVVDAPAGDVGAWTTLGVATVSLAPLAAATVPLHISVPADAEPGDHVGAVVVESTPYVAGGVRVVKRVATRIYVTVPGAATRAMRIRSVHRQVVGRLWPRELRVHAELENTGRIRVEPVVTVAGRRAEGSRVVVARSVEPYAGSVRVPWWGGRVTVAVRADAGGGLVATRHVSVFVVPWLLVAATAVTLLAAAYVSVVVVLRRRRAAAERLALEDRIRELEELVPVGQ